MIGADLHTGTKFAFLSERRNLEKTVEHRKPQATLESTTQR